MKPTNKNNKSRGHLLTEQPNPDTHALDAMNLSRAFDAMNLEDAKVAKAVARAKQSICRAITAVTNAWQNGGRLIYVGAGTSGRLGVLDASECPPTFCSPREQVQGIIAGGRKALWRSVEGIEDLVSEGRQAIRDHQVKSRDVVMGIATGGTTPFVHAALAEARKRKATTVFFACVPKQQVAANCDIDIRVLTGPEVITGSTRLKAGTATKMVLNMITTLGMIRMGKTFGNLMIDVNSGANRKLVDRASRIVARITGLDYDASGKLLKAARGRAKTAIVMHRLGCSRLQAERALEDCQGQVRAVFRRFD